MNGKVRGYSLTLVREWNGLCMDWSVNGMVREYNNKEMIPFKIYNPDILFTDHSIHGPIHGPWRKNNNKEMIPF